MYNLLPQEYQKQLHREYRMRLSVVYVVFLLVACVVAAVSVFPSYLAAFYKYSDAVNQENILKKAIIANEGDPSVLADLHTAQSEVDLINGLGSPQASAVIVIAQIASYKTSGISLIAFTVGPLVNGTRAITLTGVASSRESLVTFSQELQADKGLSGVSVPVSDFSKDKDIGFSLNVTMAVAAGIIAGAK